MWDIAPGLAFNRADAHWSDLPKAHLLTEYEANPRHLRATSAATGAEVEDVVHTALRKHAALVGS